MPINIKKIILFLLLLLFPLFIFTPKVDAAARIYPDSGTKFNLKRLSEKTMLFMNFSSKGKVKYMQKLMEERLLELEYIVETKNIAHIEKTSQRHETTAGKLTELIIDKLLRTEAGQVRDKFERHTGILEFLRDQYKYDTAEWRFVQNDINSLKIYSDMLSFY